MKRFFWLIILIALSLTACSAGSDAECREGICISLSLEGPVKALEPALVVVTLTTDTDIADLAVGITGNSTVTIYNSVETPAGAVVLLQDETYLDWQLDTIGGQEYTFSGHVILAQPTVSYGVSSYLIKAFASQPTIARVDTSMRVYLDAAGNQVDETEAQSYFESTIIAPSAPPDLTIVPFTPIPSLTPHPPTMPPPATVPAYPGPGDTSPTAPVVSSPVLTTATADPVSSQAVSTATLP